jgi:hypothetical protein
MHLHVRRAGRKAAGTPDHPQRVYDTVTPNPGRSGTHSRSAW